MVKSQRDETTEISTPGKLTKPDHFPSVQMNSRVRGCGKQLHVFHNESTTRNGWRVLYTLLNVDNFSNFPLQPPNPALSRYSTLLRKAHPTEHNLPAQFIFRWACERIDT